MAHKDQAQRTASQRRRRNTLEGRLASLITNARSHSKPRGHDAPSITLEDLKALWAHQGGACYYTGWAMSTITGSPNVASLERLDNAIGYTKDNCVLVCWMANNSKQKLSHNMFVELCRAVVAEHDGVRAVI